MSKNYDKCFELVLKLTKEAGKLIRERIWKVKRVQLKSSAIDLVTETDQEVEKLLIGGIQSAFPDHKFIGEETTAEGVTPTLTCSPTWIIDPVDGTMNFVHGYPQTCISIALMVDRISEIGIIYNPILEQLFHARRGCGAYINDTKITSSSETDLSKALILLEAGTGRDPEKVGNVMDNFKRLLPACHGLRANGSCAINMAMVATGGADGYVEFGIHIWDIAAGDLIVREAGGVVIDPAGGPLDLMSCRMLCAGTPALADCLVKTINHEYYPTRDA